MTTPDLQALIDAEAASIRAFNDHEQDWQVCQSSHPYTHHRSHYCEHQVRELAEHLVRNRVQREDAQRQALVKALERIATFQSAFDYSKEALIAQAVLKGQP